MPCIIPADVPCDKQKIFVEHYEAITKKTDHIFIFACDQKIEHLHTDFYGTHIHPTASNPEHMFSIANQSNIGAMATHLGLIARYGAPYKNINYIAKLNGKTPLASHDPLSTQLWTVQDAAELAHHAKLSIRGVGYTVYLGSEYESIMLEQAAQIVYEAHQCGLLAMLWIYPRGKAIENELDGALIAGACGVATSLGADIVKIKPPQDTKYKTSAEWLTIATQAAGNTQVICAGGQVIAVELFLQQLYEQMHTGNTAGCATGRNIFQRAERDAIALTNAISAIVYHNKTVEKALGIYRAQM